MMQDETPYLPDLYWDMTFEIVLNLMDVYREVDVEQLGLEQLREMVVTLPNFADDPELVNEGILRAILREWYEEANPV